MEIKSRIKDERGSISILVLAFFLITILLLIIITDVAEVAIAKRSLTQATESAAQRGVRNLNKEAYYQGEFDATTMAANLFGLGPDDPGIPIDCNAARSDVEQGLEDWVSGDRSLTRVELSDLKIDELYCDGFSIQVRVSARVTLPLAVPLLGAQRMEIHSTVGTVNTRDQGFYLFGIRIL